MNADLRRFVREALARGLPREAIRSELVAAGWRPAEIEAALSAYRESSFPLPVPRRTPYLSAREAFLYLILFATLYTSAFNTGQVLFALIERSLRDPVGPWDSYSQWVRSATAGIVIAYPVFLFLSRVIGREVAREPEKLGSPVRKWLTYLTLFLCALVIIGDLTVLVTRVLGGEAPPRFVLKVVVVFLIAAAVFGHYLGDLRREEDQALPVLRTNPLPARLAAGAVFATVIVGLVLSGTPRAERARQIDEQRVDALQRISGSIKSYYDARRRLPGTLDALLDFPDGVAAETLLDPARQRRYTYRTIDSLTYELCAEFDAADNTDQRRTAQFWRHGAGRKCYRLEVTRRTR